MANIKFPQYIDDIIKHESTFKQDWIEIDWDCQLDKKTKLWTFNVKWNILWHEQTFFIKNFNISWVYDDKNEDLNISLLFSQILRKIDEIITNIFRKYPNKIKKDMKAQDVFWKNIQIYENYETQNKQQFIFLIKIFEAIVDYANKNNIRLEKYIPDIIRLIK